MTALERAKAFINSRAAKTALRIMPLAVATVVAVTVTPQAKADVALTPTNAKFVACTSAPCSGGFAIDNQTTGFSQLPPNGAFTGAVSNGNMSGHFAAPSTGTFGQPINFFFSGSATGTLLSPPITDLTISWKFDFNTPTDVTVDHVNVFFYYNDNTAVYPGGECDYVMYQDTCVVSLAGAQVLFGPPATWQVQIQPFLSSPNGSATTTWNVDYLAIDATAYTPPAPGVPEPASMLLALSGLPLIGRFIRKKR